MNPDFKEQDHMYATPLRFTFFRYSNTLVAKRFSALLLLLLSLPIGCLASR
ncbi:MAG: hypothetical protein NVS3B11_02290 [Collimonas sp.]